MIRSDTDWAPSQTAWPDSGVGRPDLAAGGPATDAGWPAAGRASSPVLDAEQETEPEIRRPEAYRRLWQPPARRPARDQALGRPYVWDGDQPLPRTSRRPADLPAGPAGMTLPTCSPAPCR